MDRSEISQSRATGRALAQGLLFTDAHPFMKANPARIPGAAEADDVADDMVILRRLSVMHAARAKLARERDSHLQALADRRKAVERLAAEVELELQRRSQTAASRDVREDGFQAQDVLLEPVETLDRARADVAQAIAEVTLRVDRLAHEQASIAERARRLAGELSAEGSRIYASLSSARRIPFTVKLMGDCCSGCNLRFPSALLGDMRRGLRLPRCPSCKRVVSTEAAS
jgi:predicted  nucleic acid-binding Zn-ribbon protein